MTVIYLTLTVIGIVLIALLALFPLFLVLFAGEFVLGLIQFGRGSRFFLIMLKSLRRNLLRTSLTYLASFVLVVVVVMTWSVLHFLGELTSEKAKDLKIIVTEKYQAGGQMPFSYAGPLGEGAARSDHPEDVRPQDSMTWQIYVGTLDSAKMTRDDQVFFIGMEPRKMLTIMDNLFDEFNPGEAHSGTGKRLAQISGIFKQEFGATKFASEVRPVLGGLIAGSSWGDIALQYINDHYGPVNSVISAYAIGDYVGVVNDFAPVDNDQLTLDKLFSWANNFVDTTLAATRL